MNDVGAVRPQAAIVQRHLTEVGLAEQVLRVKTVTGSTYVTTTAGAGQRVADALRALWNDGDRRVRLAGATTVIVAHADWRETRPVKKGEPMGEPDERREHQLNYFLALAYDVSECGRLFRGSVHAVIDGVGAWVPVVQGADPSQITTLLKISAPATRWSFTEETGESIR